MSEEDFQEWLQSALEDQLEIEDDEAEDGYRDGPVKEVCTFAEALVLTRNKGLVVYMRDGSRFQVTIVKAK